MPITYTLAITGLECIDPDADDDIKTNIDANLTRLATPAPVLVTQTLPWL